MRAENSPPSRSGVERKHSKPEKARIDLLLVDLGLAPSRERAQAMLLAGEIRVNGQRVDKPGARVATTAKVEILATAPRYSSRGGQKLEGALDDFTISARGKICADIGSSTGGFTDCLLQRGARKVYAVDVTIAQLDWKLRGNERVVTIERNARYLKPEDLGEAADLVVVDVSFISLTKILPVLSPLIRQDADVLVLIKPQFELEKREVGKGGIVKQAILHQKAIERVVASAKELGFDILDVRPSRITGTEGNQEFFLHARKA